MPLSPKGNGSRESANATPCDQHPQSVCGRSHRRKNEPEPETRGLAEMMWYVKRALLNFFLREITAVDAFQGRGGGSPSSAPCGDQSL